MESVRKGMSVKKSEDQKEKNGKAKEGKSLKMHGGNSTRGKGRQDGRGMQGKKESVRKGKNVGSEEKLEEKKNCR